MGRVQINHPAASAPEEVFEALEIASVASDKTAGQTYLYLAQPLDLSVSGGIMFRLSLTYINNGFLHYIDLLNAAASGILQRNAFYGYDYSIHSGGFGMDERFAAYNEAQGRIELYGLYQTGTERWMLERICT